MFSRMKVVQFRHLHIGPQDSARKARGCSGLTFALVHTTSLAVAGDRWDGKAFDAATQGSR